MASSHIIREVNANNNLEFEHTQFGMSISGAEKISSAMRVSKEIEMQTGPATRQGRDMLTTDFKNAFNEASREEALLYISARAKQAFTFANLMYGTTSAAWLPKMSENPSREIPGRKVSKGFMQGDPLAVLMFCSSIAPLVRTLQNEGTNTMVKFYIDDGNYMADHNDMIKILKILQSKETEDKYGLILAIEKTRIVMAERTNTETAIKDRDRYSRENKIPIENIRLHPENTRVCREPGEERKRMEAYGAEVLGTPIGSKEFVTEHIRLKAEKGRAEFAILNGHENNQQKLAFLRICAQRKFSYLFRTTLPSVINNSGILNTIKELMESTVKSCFQLEVLGTAIKDRMYMNVADNGYGLQDPETYYEAAYIAGMNACRAEIEKETGTTFESIINTRIPSAINYRKAAEKLITDNEKLKENSSAIFDKMSIKIIMEMDDRRSLKTQERLTSIKYRVTKNLVDKRLGEIKDAQEMRTIVALNNQNSNRVFTTPPVSRSYQLNNLEFTTIFKYFNDIENSEIRPGTKCNCADRPLLDSRTGPIHFARCAKDAGLVQIHDTAKNLLNDILVFSGRKTVMEERNIFEDDKRPDITIQNPIKGNKEVCIDCVVTADTEKTGGRTLALLQFGPTISKKNMLDKNYYIRIKEKEKTNKYDAECTRENKKFLPAAFTTKANWSDKTEEMIIEHMEHISESRKYDKETMINWARNKLVFGMARSIGKIILNKINITQGSAMRTTEFSQVINEIENQAVIESHVGRNTNSKLGRSNPLLIYMSNNGREQARN